MPGVPRHFALEGSTLYYFARGCPRQNPPLLDHCMGLPWQIHQACPALVQYSIAVESTQRDKVALSPSLGAFHIRQHA